MGPHSFLAAVATVGVLCWAREDMEISPIGREPTGQDVIFCGQGDCVQDVFDGKTVLCDNKNNTGAVATCEAIDVQNSFVGCEAGTCNNSTFINSTVDCFVAYEDGEKSCVFSNFT